MLRRDQTKEEADPAGLDGEIMIPAPECDTAHLLDAKAPALGAIVKCHLLEKDHPMCDAVEVHVAAMSRQVIEQQHCAIAPREEMLQGGGSAGGNATGSAPRSRISERLSTTTRDRLERR